MLEIITNDKSISFIKDNQKLERTYNSVDYNIVDNDTIIFQHVSTRSTLASERIINTKLNGGQLTVDNANEKLKDALFF